MKNAASQRYAAKFHTWATTWQTDVSFDSRLTKAWEHKQKNKDEKEWKGITEELHRQSEMERVNRERGEAALPKQTTYSQKREKRETLATSKLLLHVGNQQQEHSSWCVVSAGCSSESYQNWCWFYINQPFIQSRSARPRHTCCSRFGPFADSPEPRWLTPRWASVSHMLFCHDVSLATSKEAVHKHLSPVCFSFFYESKRRQRCNQGSQATGIRSLWKVVMS